MRSRTGRTYAVSAATAVTLALAGCGGGGGDGDGDGPTASPTRTNSPTASATASSVSPSASASASPSVSASASIDIPPAARANTDAGAIAFVRFYFDQVNLAYTKPDTMLLPALAKETCQSCTGLQDGVVELANAGQRMKSDLVAPPSPVIAPEAPAGQTWVRFELTQMTVPVINASGDEQEGQKASSVAKIMSVAWEGNQWQVVGIANQA